VLRRISSGDDKSSRVTTKVLRPSSSEPLIISPDSTGAPPPLRRRVARDPSANPSPPLGLRRSSSSSPAEGRSSPATSSAVRGPAQRSSFPAEGGPTPGRDSAVRGPRQRQPPPPLVSLPPPTGRRPAAGGASASSKNSSSRTAGKTDVRQRRGIRAVKKRIV